MSSRNIEENVVKMRFDNSEFDTNVEQSNETLDKFKTTITSLPENIYLGISNAISKINLSDIIGIGATLAGISLVRQGIIGIGNEIQSIAYGALNTINSVFNAAINQINEGGKQRALNIANAKFQIEGLKLSVDTFMEAADYAVSGTAYGLDAAAKVASQLGASGVTELEELKKALRGVSGVAAMANSSYEEIGHLFTVIASNGKLMTEQIRSFSSRGLNLSAELGKALNKTEKEINDMVTKGQIDFKTFYTAMDEAFGEHAKDANKTFTGAMSNVRAALSRIGEGLWTPILDNAIGVFNELRLSINAFNAALKDVDGQNSFSIFANAVKSIFGDVENMIKLVKYALTETDFMKELGTLFMAISDTGKRISDAFSIDYGFVMNDIFRGFTNLIKVIEIFADDLYAVERDQGGLRKLGGEIQSLLVWISSFSSIFLDIFGERHNSIYETINSWVKALKSVFTTITDILGINRKSIEDLFKGAVNAVFDLIENLKLSDDRIDKITRTFRGAASVLDIIKMAVQAIFNFVKPLFGYIPDAVDGILSISAAIGDWLYNLRNVIKEGQTFEKIFDGIKGVAIFIKDLITNIGGNFFEAFFGDEAKNETLLNKIKNFIKLIGETISQAFDNLNIEGLDLGPIQEFINNLANFGLSSGETEDAESLIDRLGKFFGKIGEGLGKIGDFFQSHIFTIFTGENETFNKFVDFTKKFGEGIGDSLTAISDFLNNTAIPEAEAIAIVALIWKAMDCIKDILIAFIQGITEIVKVLASEFGGKELLMPILDKIVDRYLGSKTLGFFDRINGFIDRFSQLKGLWSYTDNTQNEQAQLMTSIGEMLKGFAWAFVGIAAALFIIALIPADRLGPAVETLSKFIIILGIVTAVLLILNKILPNFNNALVRCFNITSSGNGIGLFSHGMSNSIYADPLHSVGQAFQGIGLGLLELAAALYIISKINPEGLKAAETVIVVSTIVIVGVLAAFALLSKQIGYYGDEKIKNIGIAFAAIGAGLLMLSLGIALIASAVKPEEAAKLIAIGVVLAILVTVAGLMIGFCSKISTNVGNALLTAGMIFVVLGSITAMLAVLATSLIALSFIDSDKLVTASMVIGGLIIAIGGIVSLMMLAANAAAAPQALAALGIAAGIIVAICLNLVAVGFILAEVARTVEAISKAVVAIKELLDMFKEMDDSDADKMVKNIVKVLGGIALAIPAAFEMYYEESTKSVVKLFPRILNFITNQLIPFIDNLFGIVIPSLVTNAILAIQTLMDSIRNYMPNVLDIFDNLMFSGGGILIFIFGILDKMWNDTVEWMEGRIPVWVADIVTLLLILITAINAAFEDNWEEFDKQIQLFIDHTLAFLTDLLTNEKTKDDLSELVGGIFSRIAQIVEENKDLIQSAFENIGRVMGSALLGGLAETMPDNAIGAWISDMLQSGSDSISQTSVGLTPTRGSSSINGYSDISSYSGIDLSDMTGMDTGILNQFLGIGNVNTVANQTTSNNTSSNNMPKKLDLNLTVDATPNTRYTFKQMSFHTDNQKRSGSVRVFGD